MMWTLPVLVLGLVVHGIHVLGLVALVVRDLGLVVFVVPVLAGHQMGSKFLINAYGPNRLTYGHLD